MAPEARTPVFCTTFDPLWHQWAPKLPSLVRTLFCNTCALVKSQKIPSYVSPTRATKKLEIIHSEVCGWISPSSFGGYRYFVTFRDDFSRYVWVYCLRNKEDVYETFVTWKAQVERESGCNVILLCSDAGGEYNNDLGIWGRHGFCSRPMASAKRWQVDNYTIRSRFSAMDSSISQHQRLELETTQGQVCVLLNRCQLLITRIGPDAPSIYRGNCEPTAQLSAHGIRCASRPCRHVQVVGKGG